MAVIRRDIDGILLLNKPYGISSNAALQRARRLFNAKKAGHTGSLDPLASGMLPICFGEATKFSQYLLDADKEYLVTAQLGIKTTSGDAEGEIILKREVTVISDSQLLSVLNQFLGSIRQIPPMYSALKFQGQPLYKLARRGLEVERKPREVHIYKLELLGRTADTLTLQVQCSKGTYIRSLVEDIGEALGCGAHITQLQRVATGGFKAPQMLTFSQLEQTDSALLQQYLLPIDSALQHLPVVELSLAAANSIRLGQIVAMSHAQPVGIIRLLDNNRAFIGLGKVLEDGRIAPQRLLKQSTQE